MPETFESRFTGLFARRDRIPLRPHDPAIVLTAGELPPWRLGDPELGSGGCGWTAEQADAACLGEAIERVLARLLPGDGIVRSSYARRSFEAIDPQRWVLFHRDQYARPGFPLEPLNAETECDWLAMREAVTGREVWVPIDFVMLMAGCAGCQRFLHGFSTGLSAGRVGDPVLLRGVQEVIERDALVGGWWGRYPVEEWPAERVWTQIGRDERHRLERPNLTYRFYRIQSPFSSGVTMVSLLGLDVEGEVFSVGSACRESLTSSWRKSLLEVVQGRHCVRRLLAESRPTSTEPTTFLEHALYYSLHPDQRARTVLERATTPTDVPDADESLAVLRERLGPQRPILFRLMTPPFAEGWIVVRVAIPGLQPLHGDHRLPFLGGPLWGRPIAEWAEQPPHPFA